MKVVKKLFFVILSFALHSVAMGIIAYFAWPIAQWYWDKIPARGIDLYNSATYVSYFLRHFAPFFSGWKYIWYEGSPLGADYPFLHFYLMLPFSKAFGLIRGIQIFALSSHFILLIFSYLLFFELSSSRVLSVILSIALAYTVNIYRALIWAGGIPYFASQMFLPICLLLTVKYLKTKKRTWLYSLALVAGIGMLGHPQPFVTAVFPLLILLILLWADEKENFFQWRKIKDLAVLGLFSLLIALPGIYNLIVVGLNVLLAFIPGILGRVPLGAGTGGPGSLAKSKGSYGAGSILEEATPEVIEWARQRFLLSFEDTNILLWLFLGFGLLFFLLSLLVAKNRLKKLFSIFPFALGLVYVIFYAYLLSIGINIYHGSWYKVFWPIPVMVAVLASFLWGKARSRLLLINLALVLVGCYLFLTYSNFQDIITRIDRVNVMSSAFPEFLSVHLDEGYESLKQKLVPSFLNPSSKDFRLYIIDATVNIWWNAFFDLPLARGYIDPPHLGEAGTIFWLNSALSLSPARTSSSLVDDWGVSEEIAANNTRFLLDWFSIKYLEGNHVSQTSSYLAPYATSEELIQREEVVEVPGKIKFYLEEWGGEEWLPEEKTKLNFYEIKDEIVSPILAGTNASAVAVIGDESAYDTISRALGLLNLNSQKLIFVRGPKFIDDWRLADFSHFDALILYNYDYHRYDRAWGLIEKYLERGGKVFVETGSEVKESNSIHLPLFFPIRQTVREDLGKDWEIEVQLDKFWPIKFDEFSPLDFDGKPWNISHPPGLEDLDRDAEVILKNKGHPVIVAKQADDGEVIWSGLNLPYHLVRNQNSEEAKLFKMILAKLIALEPKRPASSKIDWISSEKRKVVGEGAKGVLFKEQHFPGWTAVFQGPQGTKKLKIYSAGPTLPGLMYVRVPESEAFEITFRFKGDPKIWLYTGVSFITIIFLLDYILLKEKVLGAGIKYLSGLIKKRAGKWWEKEEEY